MLIGHKQAPFWHFTNKNPIGRRNNSNGADCFIPGPCVKTFLALIKNILKKRLRSESLLALF